jgi:c-di-GMP-binding flagellar brake protein YcgR
VHKLLPKGSSCGPMSPSPKLDLRNSVRFPLYFPVTVTTLNEEYRAETIDISAGGVLLHTEASLGVGSSVEFSIEIPSDVLGLDHVVLVRCQGRVVRCSTAPCAAGQHVALVIDEYYFDST